MAGYITLLTNTANLKDGKREVLRRGSISIVRKALKSNFKVILYGDSTTIFQTIISITDLFPLDSLETNEKFSDSIQLLQHNTDDSIESKIEYNYEKESPKISFFNKIIKFRDVDILNRTPIFVLGPFPKFPTLIESNNYTGKLFYSSFLGELPSFYSHTEWTSFESLIRPKKEVKIKYNDFNINNDGNLSDFKLPDINEFILGIEAEIKITLGSELAFQDFLNKN